MEEIVAIILIFGGGALAVLSYSPIGRAVAARIRGEIPGPVAGTADPAVFDEIDRLRHELAEVQERLDFTERMLADEHQPVALKQPEE